MWHRLVRTVIAVVTGLIVLALLLTATAAYVVISDGPTAAVPPPDAHGHDIRTGDVVTRYQAWGNRGRCWF